MSPTPTPTRFLSALSPRQRLRLSLDCPQRGLRRGEDLYLPGDEAASLYVIQSGRFKLGRLHESGREITLCILEPGDILGLELLQGLDQRLDRATALEAVRVLPLGRERLDALLAEQPGLSQTLLRILGEKLLDSQHALERLLLGDVKARLACLLLDLARRCGVPCAGGIQLATRITHQDLASLIGSTRETTTATLNQFRRSRLIDVQRRQITISGWEALERLAG